MKKCMILAAFIIISWKGAGQSDLIVGTNYQLNIQRQNNHADAFFLHNAQFDSGYDLSRWKDTHASFGSRGIRMSYLDGIHFYANNQATTAGATFTPVTRFFIGNNGSVGIGTTNPLSQTRLMVYEAGSSSSTWRGRIVSSGEANAVVLGEWNGKACIGAHNPSLTAWSDLFLQFDGGNVGIGTLTASQKLEVRGNILQNSENSAFGIDDRTNARLGIIKKAGYWPLIASDNLSPIIFGQTNQSGIHTNIAGATLTERMRIDVNGNVGIGMPGPWVKLQVSGTVGDSNSGILRLEGAGAIASLHAGVNTDYAWMQSHGSRPLRINELGNDVLFNVQGWGNVGIGTASPDSRLTVNGTIHSTRVKIDLTVPGPDYVFEKDYKLPSLEEIKKYIDENKRLPEVPSAKEMEKNGIDVGEMNMILLKKVEELTLYVLELKKENEEIRKQLQNK